MVSEKKLKIDLKHRQIFNIKVLEFFALSTKGLGRFKIFTRLPF